MQTHFIDLEVKLRILLKYEGGQLHVNIILWGNEGMYVYGHAGELVGEGEENEVNPT